MVDTIRHEMTEAVISYEEKPREVWVFDPPAQVALCSVQIWWTVEVNIAFQRLEEGYENAMKDFNKKQVRDRNLLLKILLCINPALHTGRMGKGTNYSKS